MLMLQYHLLRVINIKEKAMNMLSFLQNCIKESLIENQEEKKVYQNKINLKNYYEDKNLMSNAIIERSFKNTLEHIAYLKKIRNTIILANLKETIL